MAGDQQEEHPQYRRWTARPAAPVLYGVLARLSDWLNGRRDAEGGLPDIRDAREGGPAHTPSERLLRARGEVQKGREDLKFAKWRAQRGHKRGLDSLRLQVKEAEERRDAKLQEFNAIEVELPAAALRSRRSGEVGTSEARTSEAVVASRRTAEHAARRRRAESEYQKAAEEAAAARADLERFQAGVDLEQNVLETRKRLIDRHGDRRSVSYMRSLIRSHRNGPEVLDELARRHQNPEGSTK
ncbi:hypothetical protein Caci_6947 [Catenulispora acidiphila DSM 44928]|uniref:Uncharacterized protein n=1 Tax=Catenulispora acidiphila (strain DSM 44928 / JCM 14897 / NBRC 102108 / NRRL B-24433 / ID139908) TaxID=479433 RepID=C7Q3L3_CATAD|nr:hypothetical protein [Catenulispora acidiphila]ACU75778.1 hypothetical protein Caci_6947 [Catenulispora acidiphila DSM 44928]